MPFGSRCGRLGQWWTDRSSAVQRTLIVVTSIATILIVIIIILARPNRAPLESEETICTSPTCIKEAAIILAHIDPNAKPCDDFYLFSCGNSSKDETVDTGAFGNQLLLELYKEPIREGEHKILKATQKLFQACMDEEQIERDQLVVMKEVLKKAGGWPVLEGDNWDEAGFDWIKTTYKLRELGYYYTIFLDFGLVADTRTSRTAHVIVSSLGMYDKPHGLFKLDTLGFMHEVANIFGVEDVENVSLELADAHTFGKELKKYEYRLLFYFDYADSFKKISVEEYQRSCKNIEWLGFINKIIGPTDQLSKDDLVYFPPPQNLTKWFDLISRTSKRTQANYMMWRVIEETLPYLTEQLRGEKGGLWEDKTREEFCVRETQQRFTADPIFIMANRRHLLIQRKNQLEEMSLNIKQELVEMLIRIKWMDENDKQKVIEMTKAIKIMTARPQTYFDEDDVLDNLDVDMVETKNVDFLSLLAQANRNRASINFQLKKPIRFNDHWFIAHDGLPLYIAKLNALYVSPIITISSMFNEKRPHYLNYGSMGYIVALQLIDAVYKLATEADNGWSSKTKQAFLNKIRCVEKDLGNSKLGQGELTSEHLLYQTIGQLVSYSAYEKWTQTNGEEPKLISVQYTPKQLFWFAVASTVFIPDILPRVVPIRLISNKNFANAFGCPSNFQPNPLDVCHIF